MKLDDPSLYEDIKFIELCKTQRTILICFTIIISVMIASFFIWASMPVETTTETYTQEVDDANESSIFQNIGGSING